MRDFVFNLNKIKWSFLEDRCKIIVLQTNYHDFYLVSMTDGFCLFFMTFQAWKSDYQIQCLFHGRENPVQGKTNIYRNIIGNKTKCREQILLDLNQDIISLSVNIEISTYDAHVCYQYRWGPDTCCPPFQPQSQRMHLPKADNTFLKSNKMLKKCISV